MQLLYIESHQYPRMGISDATQMCGCALHLSVCVSGEQDLVAFIGDIHMGQAMLELSRGVLLKVTQLGPKRRASSIASLQSSPYIRDTEHSWGYAEWLGQSQNAGQKA